MENPWVAGLDPAKKDKWRETCGSLACEMHGTEDLDFAMWMDVADLHVIKRIGLSVRDLEDWDYSSVYDEGMYPRDAATMRIEDIQIGGF